jgi:hypothetical protein
MGKKRGRGQKGRNPPEGGWIFMGKRLKAEGQILDIRY